MDSLSSHLCAGVLSGLGANPTGKSSLTSALFKASFVPSRLEEGQGIQINKLLSNDFVSGVSYDFERFSLSSRETFLVANIEREQHGVFSWPLLKIYYSSFFAAHAIMRSRGHGVVNLDKKTVEHLNAVANIYDDSIPTLTPGMYTFSRQRHPDNAPSEISLVFRKDSSGRGVHEGFWDIFCKFLNSEAEKSVHEGAVNSAVFLGLVSELQDAIRSMSARRGIWISFMRNGINYQHNYDSWMPYKRSSECYKAFDSRAFPLNSGFRLDISKDKKPIEAFLNINSYISILCFNVSEHISCRSKRGGSFGQRWVKLNSLLSET